MKIKKPTLKLIHGSRGFTLIELLLGLSIFAVIALSLYVTFANGIRLNQESQKNQDFYREARLAVETLSRDLENMVPYHFQDSSSQRQGAFRGDERKLSLILATDSGLKEIRYYLQKPDFGKIHQVIVGESTVKNIPIMTRFEGDSGVHTFVREERPFPYLNSSDAGEKAEAEILSSLVPEGSLRFSYANKGKDPKNGSLNWSNQWEESYLPAGVRLEISFVHPEDVEHPLIIQRDMIIPRGLWGTKE